MVRWIVIKLTEREYQILENLDDIPGKPEEKMKELFIQHLTKTPRLKAGYHLIKLDEKKENLYRVLESIWEEYVATTDPMENWDQEKLDKILENLLAINAIQPVALNYVPTYIFRKSWLTAYRHVSTVFPDVDEFSQAYIATVYILDYLSKETFDLELSRDAAIFLNEKYMASYAIAKKQAHDFEKVRPSPVSALPSSYLMA